MRPVREANLKLFEHDKNEKLIGEVPRHPIGLFLIVLSGLFLIIVFLIGLFYGILYQTEVQDSVGLDQTYDVSGWIVGLVSVMILLVFVGTIIAAYVYHNNYLILTDQKLVLIYTINLFSRQVSQLSIGDVQDVTIDQTSIMSRVFKYGRIRIETAGEQANFTFLYAVDPFESGKSIVQAHEENLKLYGN
jgi:uncharacterized membrane protein YdbT with pleckstrin-like domain